VILAGATYGQIAEGITHSRSTDTILV
jgi:hypothetical protein